MEYRSRVRPLGLPLVHVAIGRATADGRYRRGVATAWFALGDVAFGVLFALGGAAVGGLSIGGIAVGLLPIGGLAIGLLALGGLGVGVVAFGGAAFARYAAIGGLAVARDYAIGGVASARNTVTHPSSGSLPLSSIPHPPVYASDVLLLIGLLAALWIFARWVGGRRDQAS